MHKLGSAYADSRWKKLGNHPVLTPCYQGARDATVSILGHARILPSPTWEANSFIVLFTKN